MTDTYADSMQAAADAKGLVVVYPEPNELFIDIDSAEDFAVFAKNVLVLGDLVSQFVSAPSPLGKPERLHITVTLSRPVASSIERIAMQAALGSDRLHETLSLRIALAGGEHPTVFFEKPAAGAQAAQ